MYALMVSHNCGMSYYKEAEAETLADLRPKMAELDRRMLRWCLEKDGADCWEEVCAIFSGIMHTIENAHALAELENVGPGEGRRE